MKKYVTPNVRVAQGERQNPHAHNDQYWVEVGMVDGEPAVVTPAANQYQVEIYDTWPQAIERAQELGWDPELAGPLIVTDTG